MVGSVPDRSTTAYRWPRAAGLHLLPGLLFFIGCVALRPLDDALGLPASMGFTLAGLLLVTPFELGYLARRGTGRSVDEAIADAAGFAATHFWEPALIPFVFVVQAVLGLIVRRTGSVRVSVLTHIAVNTISTALTIAALA